MHNRELSELRDEYRVRIENQMNLIYESLLNYPLTSFDELTNLKKVLENFKALMFYDLDHTVDLARCNKWTYTHTFDRVQTPIENIKLLNSTIRDCFDHTISVEVKNMKLDEFSQSAKKDRGSPLGWGIAVVGATVAVAALAAACWLVAPPFMAAAIIPGAYAVLSMLGEFLHSIRHVRSVNAVTNSLHGFFKPDYSKTHLAIFSNPMNKSLIRKMKCI